MSAPPSPDKQLDEELEVLTAAVQKKRYILERLKNDHEKEQEQSQRDFKKVTDDNENLCQLAGEHEIDLDTSLTYDTSSEKELKKATRELQQRLDYAMFQLDTVNQELEDQENFVKKYQEDLEDIAEGYSEDAKNSFFRDMAAQHGVYFTLENVDGKKYVYVPSFFEEYPELELEPSSLYEDDDDTIDEEEDTTTEDISTTQNTINEEEDTTTEDISTTQNTINEEEDTTTEDISTTQNSFSF